MTNHAPRTFTTTAIHTSNNQGGSAPPIHQGVNATRPEGMVKYISSVGGAGGPTTEALETLVQELEGAAWTVAVPSGMAAINHVFMSLLSAGERVVVHRSVYQYATELLNHDLPKRFGVEVEWVDMRDLDALKTALQKPTKLVYFEPITNPAFHVVDVAAIIELAHQAGALAAMDNTLLTPYLFRPIPTLKADIVLHSATKYLGGHGDALSGVISGHDPQIGEQIARWRRLSGGILAPLNAYLVMRGIRTLPFRMAQHCANAQAVANFLQTLPQVTAVRHVGLSENPLKDQFAGCGGIFGFTLSAEINPETVRQNLVLCNPWGSLGDVGTLVAHPTANPFRDVPANYLRVAVGLESAEDICADLKQAIEKASEQLAPQV